MVSVLESLKVIHFSGMNHNLQVPQGQPLLVHSMGDPVTEDSYAAFKSLRMKVMLWS